MYKSKSDSWIGRTGKSWRVEEEYERRGLSLPTRSDDIDICEIEDDPRKHKSNQCVSKMREKCARFYEQNVPECRTQIFYMGQHPDACAAGYAFPQNLYETQMLPETCIDCCSGGRVMKLPPPRSDSNEGLSEALSAKERFCNSKCYHCDAKPSCSYQCPPNDQYKQQLCANWPPQTPKLARCSVPMLIRATPSYVRFPNNNNMCFRPPRPPKRINQRVCCFCDYEDSSRFDDSSTALVPQQCSGCNNNNMSVLCIPNEITFSYPQGCAAPVSWPNECICLDEIVLPTPPDNNNDRC